MPSLSPVGCDLTMRNGFVVGTRRHGWCQAAQTRAAAAHQVEEILERWEGKAWASARMHAHVLSPLPTGTFPGVDDAEMYEFLETHAATP